MPNQIPVADGLFSWPPTGANGESHLIGSRCVTCGNHMFPTQSGCPKCTGNETDTVALGRRGTLWTWTVQGFPPKAPPYAGRTDAGFEPFGVGYVELPGEVKVEARLTEADPAKLRIGMEMELVLVPLYVDAGGNEVMTFAFQPVGETHDQNGAE